MTNFRTMDNVRTSPVSFVLAQTSPASAGKNQTLLISRDHCANTKAFCSRCHSSAREVYLLFAYMPKTHGAFDVARYT